MPQRAVAPVISRTELLSQGLSDHQIRRARERGELHSVLPGLYVRSAGDPPADPAERHRATLTVVVPLLVGRPVVSHVSAAVMHASCSPVTQPLTSVIGSRAQRNPPQSASVLQVEVTQLDW